MTLSFVACGSKGNETKGNDDKKEGGKKVALLVSGAVKGLLPFPVPKNQDHYVLMSPHHLQ